jgi:hypothetical protein
VSDEHNDWRLVSLNNAFILASIYEIMTGRKYPCSVKSAGKQSNPSVCPRCIRDLLPEAWNSFAAHLAWFGKTSARQIF